MRDRWFLMSLVCLFVLVSAPIAEAVDPALAKPSGGPLCFTDAYFDMTWNLDTLQVGTHWLVTGHARYNSGPNAGSVTRVTGTGYGSGFFVVVVMEEGTVYAGVNMNSPQIWWPGANMVGYVYYGSPSHEHPWTYEVYTYTTPSIPLTKAPCS